MELKWESVKTESDWRDTDTGSAAVPGGWIVRSIVQIGNGTPAVMAMVYVPDPTAPHCQRTPADGPPMTDNQIAAWLTAKYGKPLVADDEWPLDREWRITDGGIVGIVSFDSARAGDGWSCTINGKTRSNMDAVTFGPALWAAHKYGGQS